MITLKKFGILSFKSMKNLWKYWIWKWLKNINFWPPAKYSLNYWRIRFNGDNLLLFFSTIPSNQLITFSPNNDMKVNWKNWKYQILSPFSPASQISFMKGMWKSDLVIWLIGYEEVKLTKSVLIAQNNWKIINLKMRISDSPRVTKTLGMIVEIIFSLIIPMQFPQRGANYLSFCKIVTYASSKVLFYLILVKSKWSRHFYHNFIYLVCQRRKVFNKYIIKSYSPF